MVLNIFHQVQWTTCSVLETLGAKDSLGWLDGWLIVLLGRRLRTSLRFLLGLARYGWRAEFHFFFFNWFFFVFLVHRSSLARDNNLSLCFSFSLGLLNNYWLLDDLSLNTFWDVFILVRARLDVATLRRHWFDYRLALDDVVGGADESESRLAAWRNWNEKWTWAW